VAAGGTWKLFGACVRVFGEEISRVLWGPTAPLNHNPRERRSCIPSLRGEKDFYLPAKS